MTPAICVAALSFARCPVVATFHASGELGWMRYALYFWGALMDRIDHRIAVSEQARDSAARWLPGAYDVVPNGVLIPPEADPGNREHRIAFVGRHEPRKGLQVLLRAWPTVHAATGARLRLIGADPLAVGLLQRRLGVSTEGIDVLGFLSQDELTAELLSAKALAAPSIGGESFGMVLTRAFACALPVVASDIPGYRDVATGETSLSVPPGDPVSLAQALVAIVEDEPRRQAMGVAARELAQAEYGWETIARRLAGVYELVTGQARVGARA